MEYVSVSNNENSISVFCDKYIISGGDVLFMSLFGNDVPLKSVYGSLLSNMSNGVYIKEDGEITCQYRRTNFNMRSETIKLAPSLFHTLIYAPDFFIPKGQREFVLTGKNEREVRGKAYKLLSKFGRTPLLPEWQDVILKECVTIESLKYFGFDYAGYVIFAEEDSIMDFVMRNVKQFCQIVKERKAA